MEQPKHSWPAILKTSAGPTSELSIHWDRSMPNALLPPRPRARFSRYLQDGMQGLPSLAGSDRRDGSGALFRSERGTHVPHIPQAWGFHLEI